ncbi:MAG: site-specific DNA-methyltransferase [Acidobacteria bacterium]|nr:site-specific DNA-methyltransferase [Acidobacteriota bacterium]
MKRTPKSTARKSAARRGASKAPRGNRGSAFPPAVKPGEAVKVAAAKGRPMLVWVGKRPLTRVTAFPAQLIEQFSVCGSAETRKPWSDWPSAYPTGGLLFHGDNKEVLAHLLANGFRGKVNLIYIDPPFDSGADYVRKVSLRGATGSAKLDGERYTLGEQIQYTDIWANDNYLQFMYERSGLLRELLHPAGFLFVHLNTDRSHYLKAVLDEVFGAASFTNEIIWKRREAHGDTKGIANVHDVILGYASDPGTTLLRHYVSYDQDYLDSHYTQTDESGRRYTLADLTAPGPRPGLNYAVRGVWPPPGRVWAVLPEKMEKMIQSGRVVFTAEGRPRKKLFLDEMPGMPVHDVWTDVFPINSQALEATGYPTQKPEALLERLITIGCPADGLVLDCFVGSGTTAAVAQKLGRRWIGCDINKGAIHTTAKRIQAVIREQCEAMEKRRAEGAQTSLLEAPYAKPQESSTPPQLSFSVWRVNDYDLQIQHDEAVNLACEHIGIERTRADAFFDGTLGRHLIKIIPFDHPLSPVDLEELRRELDSRPDEDREITLVCLGIEIAARSWIDDWNRLRKGKNAANRLHVIELRSDETYGSFIRHEPAQANVRITRKDGRVTIAIEDFVSPSIVTRLRQQAGVLQPKIDDWRAMVDCVMVDAAWDGSVFNVALSDIPERKSDLVKGSYEIDVPPRPTTVAVKIIDMLGEEVLVTRKV